MIKLNGAELSFKTFPNGETLMNGDELSANVHANNSIVWRYGNDGDLIKLMFVKRYLDERRASCSLTILYMPYSRMDRVEGASAFTLKYVASFINSLQFEAVKVIEPHSDVTLALLDRSTAVYPTLELLERVEAETGFDRGRDYLFFPDAGAQKRYGKTSGYKQLVGFKSRDFATGEIKGLEIVGAAGDPPFHAIIVDDLCSYGGTFLRSAEKLKEIGAERIYLLVTHCEKSVFKGRLLESGLVDKVFTTDTMLDEAGHERIRLFESGGLLI
ncbi:ribose-phosphate pyrophosphokinase [Paenibacillus sp. N4]|uniref:ribose-phosphate pyrophosphokinase n=1 Tax=Paenibacillus vietnamensis TaxID=2590547 RepID=UPI001CD101CB|nr:ribose-phosphate pyrophosphokinase [Paenibacillus vietnamensis]MCA0756611.1 ribose-phosphate pyrophosphokinase [Paenibacillus vietnamensis]